MTRATVWLKFLGIAFLGLVVTPYTFRSASVPSFPDVTAEMRHYLDTFAVEGVITDNPDRAPVR